MKETDHEPIVTIAFLAAVADGQAGSEELSSVCVRSGARLRDGRQPAT